MDLAGDADIAGDDDRAPEQQAARRVQFPSSIGLSVLVSKECEALDAMVSWGDYTPEGSCCRAQGREGRAFVLQATLERRSTASSPSPTQ